MLNDKTGKKINFKKGTKDQGQPVNPTITSKILTGQPHEKESGKKKARRSIIYKKLMLKEEIKKN